MTARRRLKAWMEWADLQQEDVGERIGLTQGAVSMLLRGKIKKPSYEVVRAIERETKAWPEGPIMSDEWFSRRAKPEAA